MRAFHRTIGALASAMSLSGPLLVSALAHTPSPQTVPAATSPDQPAANTTAPSTDLACETCAFVIERIRRGTTSLPAICSAVQAEKGADASASCRQTLAALEQNGANARSWLIEGCYEAHADGSKQWVRPCPTKEICTRLTTGDKQPFCPTPQDAKTTR